MQSRTMRILIGPGLFATEGTSQSNLRFLCLTPCLFSGEQHRRQRKMLNPVFSTNHLRGRIPLFYSVTNQVGASLRRRTRPRKF